MARIFNSLAAEIMLLLLVMCMFGSLAAIATETPPDRDVLQTFIRQLALDESLPASLAISLLIVGIFAMSLSATNSILSASLWVLHYDLLPALWPILTPEGINIFVGCGLCVAAILLVAVADTLFGIRFVSSLRLAFPSRISV